jgi:hypothetical protein
MCLLHCNLLASKSHQPKHWEQALALLQALLKCCALRLILAELRLILAELRLILVELWAKLWSM